VGHAPGLLKTILSQGSPQGGQTYVAATTVFHGWSAAIAIVEPVLRQPAAIVAPAPALMNVLRVTSSCFDFFLVFITLAPMFEIIARSSLRRFDPLYEEV
jgi:hypothetical protein